MGNKKLNPITEFIKRMARESDSTILREAKKEGLDVGAIKAKLGIEGPVAVKVTRKRPTPDKPLTPKPESATLPDAGDASIVGDNLGKTPKGKSGGFGTTAALVGAGMFGAQADTAQKPGTVGIAKSTIMEGSAPAQPEYKPSEPQTDEAVGRQIAGLISAEGGKYNAKTGINPETGKRYSTAVGKGQWLKENWGKLEKATNLAREDWYPSEGDTEEDAPRKGKNQDKMLKVWWKWMGKEAKGLKKLDTQDKFTHDELAFINHYLGHKAAKNFLEKGTQPEGESKGWNRNVLDHVDTYRAARDKEQATSRGEVPMAKGLQQDEEAANAPYTEETIDEFTSNTPANKTPVKSPEDKGPKDIRQKIVDMQIKVTAALADYKKEKKSIAAKEKWAGIIQGVSMIAAGMYAMKHDLDISGLKYDAADFSNQYASAESTLNATIGGAKETLALEEKLRKLDTDDFNTAMAKEDRLFNKAQREAEGKRADRRLEIAEGKLKTAFAKADAKVGGDADKVTTKARKEFRNLYLRYGKTNDKSERLSVISELKRLAPEAGIDPSYFKDESTWFGLGSKSPSVETIESRRAAPSAPAAPEIMVKMKAANGAVGSVPASKVKDAEAKGMTRL